jgi:hypothetical protein
MSRWTDSAAALVALGALGACNLVLRTDRIRIVDDLDELDPPVPAGSSGALDAGRDASSPPQSQADACVPECTNKCGGGPDGCGGQCNGACAAGVCHAQECCVPSCAGKLCGASDGCGHLCAGKWRDTTGGGAASDCRTGHCGCGVAADNDNMVCVCEGESACTTPSKVWCRIYCPCGSDCGGLEQRRPNEVTTWSQCGHGGAPIACGVIAQQRGKSSICCPAIDDTGCPGGTTTTCGPARGSGC